jgi:hypothetical protein
MSKKRRYPRRDLVGWKVLSIALIAAMCIAHFPPVFAEETSPTHFGLLEAWVDLQATEELGIQWVRGHLEWDLAQRGPEGGFSWWAFDDYVRDVQRHGFQALVILFSFASWDQEQCHTRGEPLGPPCDMAAYRRFVRAAVERYDGDGTDDMPGLRYPLLHWEVFNEPGMKDLPPFYHFTPQDYFALLKVTYEEVKAACPRCVVVQGGVAGIAPDKERFLRSYLALGAGKYFDIANIHFIHSGDFDTLNVGPFSDILEEYGIHKPIWVTEIQIESGPGAHYPHLTDEEAAALLVKGYVRAFALGADKLFYVVLKPAPEFPPNVTAASLIDSHGEKRATYSAMRTMIEKLGHFIRVERLADGLFKFESLSNTVYVVWNCDQLPTRIFKQEVVSVTDIYGGTWVIPTKEVRVSDIPVFIEPAP